MAEELYTIFGNKYIKCKCRVGPRGAATWPGVPRRIHVAPRGKNRFLHFSKLILNHFKPKINLKNSEKIPKNGKFITFNI